MNGGRVSGFQSLLSHHWSSSWITSLTRLNLCFQGPDGENGRDGAPGAPGIPGADVSRTTSSKLWIQLTEGWQDRRGSQWDPSGSDLLLWERFHLAYAEEKVQRRNAWINQSGYFSQSVEEKQGSFCVGWRSVRGCQLFLGGRMDSVCSASAVETQQQIHVAWNTFTPIQFEDSEMSWMASCFHGDGHTDQKAEQAVNRPTQGCSSNCCLLMCLSGRWWEGPVQ